MAIALQQREGMIPLRRMPGPRVKRWLQERGVEVDEPFEQAIDSVTEECSKQLGQIVARGNEYQFKEQIKQCDEWMNDALVAHLSFDDMARLQDIDYLDVLGIKLPNADWLQWIADVPPVVGEAINACMENSACRLDYRKVAGAIVKGMILGLVHGIDWRMLRTAGGKTGIPPAYWNLRTIYFVHNAFKDLAFTSANIWGEWIEQRNEPNQRRVASRSNKYIWQEQESYMPYNRRTGQWYPSRRRYGNTYSRGYRRYNRYNRGWSPRRRRYNPSW